MSGRALAVVLTPACFVLSYAATYVSLTWLMR